ncbi:MAG: T9SS type A sorting domain-containing protein [Flavobacteriales bacterium]|nr:T9SS type A sorting domain-containing protein [Flavobacteriales bacterium]MCB9194511.1 T9SS type A sorting domain-containing protein [Flavobacteriales bacterium]
MKADAELNHIWSKHFDRHGGFQFIRELPGGDLLAGINLDTAGAVVARMDAQGNFLWCKSYIRPGGMVHDCVVESDSTYIITGVTDSVAAAGQKLFMLKLNGAGDVQWCRGYQCAQYWYFDLGPSRIAKADDGNYVLLATSGSGPVLMKVDPNGDALWTRCFRSQGYAYETADLLACANGDFLLSGIVYGTLPQGNTGLPYIFRTDSTGHLPCLEVPPPPLGQLDLFPTDSSFTLTSVDGATMYPTSVNDTVFAPINVYDACIVTSVQDPFRPRSTKPRVHPNPNTGRFTVEFPDPLTVDSFYSVYDAVGRLLFQRPLVKGRGTEEIDLSRFGKGTYLIRFTTPEAVSQERVVVQ